ncbi:MAG: hypothetical protein RL076_1458 [Chloroflexota bacterium]|jgi:cell division protein FtsZ
MTNQQPRNIQAVIRVIGVGGGGSNAIDRMIEDGVQDVTFIAVNTDAQVLRKSKADYRICIGERLTRGMGAGGNPTIGERAAEENNDELYDILKGSDMVFITAGMGGGTGTGAAPIVASIARDLGILTVGVVTKPFSFEGNRRMQQAEKGIAQLREHVDALVVVPNDRLVVNYAKKPNVSILQGFQIVDSVLRQGIQGVADLITKPGMINVDFADVRTVLAGSGQALMSIGTGQGENRIQQAIDAAMASPLLDVEIRGAKRVLMNITSNENIQLSEVAEAASTIEAIVDPDANITWGSVIDPNFPPDQVKITLVATGITVMRDDTRDDTPINNQPPNNGNGALGGRGSLGNGVGHGLNGHGNGTKGPLSGQGDTGTRPPDRGQSNGANNGTRAPDHTPPPDRGQRTVPPSTERSPLDRGVRSNFGEPRPYDDPNISLPPWARDDPKRKDSNN